MPLAIDVDREQVRMLVLAVGVREAARQMGLNEDTVASWSARFGWVKAVADIKAKAAAHRQIQGVQVPTSTPAESLANILADDSRTTKIGLSRAARAAADTFAKRSGPAVIKSSKALRDIAATASQLHGWEERKEGGLILNLGISVGGME